MLDSRKHCTPWQLTHCRTGLAAVTTTPAPVALHWNLLPDWWASHFSLHTSRDWSQDAECVCKCVCVCLRVQNLFLMCSFCSWNWFLPSAFSAEQRLQSKQHGCVTIQDINLLWLCFMVWMTSSVDPQKNMIKLIKNTPMLHFAHTSVTNR